MDILITRPYDDAMKLSQLLELSGLSIAALPVINIFYKKVSCNVEDFSDFIFTSKHAVKSLFDQYSVNQFFDKNKRIYSVGATTAKYLSDFNLDSKYPCPHNSKGLLKIIPKQDLSNRRFAIISGVAGNDCLEKELIKYTYCRKFESYERVFVDEKYLHREYVMLYGNHSPKIIVATSLDILKSLSRIFKKVNISKETIITVASSKMLEFVNLQGFYNTLELESLDNNYICSKILQLVGVNSYVREKK